MAEGKVTENERMKANELKKKKKNVMYDYTM